MIITGLTRMHSRVSGGRIQNRSVICVIRNDKDGDSRLTKGVDILRDEDSIRMLSNATRLAR